METKAVLYRWMSILGLKYAELARQAEVDSRRLYAGNLRPEDINRLIPLIERAIRSNRDKRAEVEREQKAAALQHRILDWEPEGGHPIGTRDGHARMLRDAEQELSEWDALLAPLVPVDDVPIATSSTLRLPAGRQPVMCGDCSYTWTPRSTIPAYCPRCRHRIPITLPVTANSATSDPPVT